MQVISGVSTVHMSQLYSVYPTDKKGEPTRENHVPLTIVWRQVWVRGLLFRGYTISLDGPRVFFYWLSGPWPEKV